MDKFEVITSASYPEGLAEGLGLLSNGHSLFVPQLKQLGY